MESDQNLKIKQVSNLSGTKRGSEESSDDSVSVNKKNKDSVNLEFEFDLNASIGEENCVDDVEKHNQFVHGFDLNGPVNEVIDISSDDNDDDDKKLVNSSLFDLHLGFENGSFVERKYTKEEKGKAKVDDFLSLSLTSEVQQADRVYEAPELNSRETSEPIAEAPELNSRETSEPIAATTSSTVHPQVLKKVLQIPKNQEKKGGDYSHLGSVYDFLNKMVDSDKTSKACGELKAVIDQITKREAEKLINWSPCRVDFRPSVVPSLLDLSLGVLVKNADAISSFDHVPEWLKRKLTNLLCDTHRMDIHILQLLFKDSPSEICVKNCSWMTQQQLTQTLGNSCLQNLRVLQLDYCGQCSFDDIIPNSLARSPNSLPFLGILSLKGAARLSDNTLKPLFISAPLLQSINLSQCTLLTHTAIKHMVSYLKNNLKELYIDECPRIDAHLCSRSIIELEHLEVLSIAGIVTVCDEFVVPVVVSLGDKLKELNLAGCVMLTNSCLKSIGYYCPNLCHLNLSHLCRLTDLGLCYLAAGCKSLKSLNVARTDFSDELIAAFLETSGKSLKELSLNHVSKVSLNTAFSLAKFSKDLVSLDVSWCRELTDEAIGFITDNCSSLKLLKVFGCTQLTASFLLGHANSQVSIVGRGLSLMDRVNMLEPDEILLRHSALMTPENGL